MAITVDPNNFKVPYAISPDGTLHQIKDGRPAASEILCPLCNTAVAFVRETDLRAAHFRHNTREECDGLAAYHRETLHNAVRDAAFALLAVGYGAARLCRNGVNLPSGQAMKEHPQSVGGRTYRPDITVMPKDGQAAPILELEVVYSHRPEPERVERAARDGRLIGVIDIAPIEMDYYRKLWANEAFDIPEACKAYVLDCRFEIMGGADIHRTIRGVMDRVYLDARLRPEHASYRAARPATVTQGRQNLPRTPAVCVHCGKADWTVSLTNARGEKAHVACDPALKTPVDKTVDKSLSTAPVADASEAVDKVDINLLIF